MWITYLLNLSCNFLFLPLPHFYMERVALKSKLIRDLRVICFPGGSVVKNPHADAGDAGDMGSIPASGRSPGGRDDNPFQYSCLENSMDREAWRATVRRVVNSWTWLSTHAQSVKFQKTQNEKHLVCTTYKQLPRFVMCWPSTRIALLQRQDVLQV